ncbi:MAG: GIY-YIG nuclease family protein [Bacteroidetes bacterium]|nr:GIY-YIG nuclease family protein [Bacteroidota bacterium]
MYYVYFLKSLSHNFRYVGYTSNLASRLSDHNDGNTVSTKPYAPFEIDAFIAVKTKQTAQNLEKYFKTGSGIAFARKRLLTTYEALA